MVPTPKIPQVPLWYPNLSPKPNAMQCNEMKCICYVKCKAIQ